MEKRLLLVDNTVDERYRPADDWARYLTLPADVVAAATEPLPGDLDCYTHVLFTGGLPSALENTDWQWRERVLMQKAVQDNKNVLAVCFGFQLLAQAMFGMDAVCARSAMGAAPELGWTEITVTRDDPLLGEAGESCWGYVSHFDDVCKIDERTADVIAKSPACPIHGFRIKGKNAWGLQAHFEIDIETGKHYNKNFIAAFPPLAEMILEPAKDSGFIRRLVPRFEAL